MISRKQYQVLRYIRFLSGTTGKGYQRNKDLYDYLVTEGYLKKEIVRGFSGFAVTQKGYAEMYAFKVEHFRFWFPSVVSLFALAASILSLATTNPEFWQDVQTALRCLLSFLRIQH